MHTTAVHDERQVTPLPYEQWMAHVQSLPVYALVTTGRTGSDFLQSLLDSHPEVLTFNGHFAVHTQFFGTSVCLAATPVSAGDLAREFAGTFIYKLVSRYDVQEGKDRLGATGAESFAIDIDEFVSHVTGLLRRVEITRRTFLLAVYGAYNLCLGHDLLQARILFHHPHLFHEFEEFLRDFPEAAVVATTRDPRASFVSHVEHFRRYYKTHDNEQHLYICMKMMLEDSSPLEGRGLRYVAVRLEDLPRESTLRAFSAWLGISYDEVLLRSTWAGLDWHGDRISGRTFESRGWSERRTENGWEERLGTIDKYRFNYLMQSRLQHYGYRHQPLRWWDALLAALLMPLPLRHERRFLSPHYYKGLDGGADRVMMQVGVTALFYCKRVALCYRHYLRTLRGVRFRGPWIECS